MRDVTKTDGTARAREARGGLSLLAIAGGGLARHSLPAEGDVLLGRAADATIPLLYDQVSRRHATLSVGTTLRLHDLGSKNGTRVSGRRLAANEVVELVPGDVVQVGSVVLVLQVHGEAAARCVSLAGLQRALAELCARGSPDGGGYVLARLVMAAQPARYDELFADLLGPQDWIAMRDDGCELLVQDPLPGAAIGALERVTDRLRQAGAVVRSGAAAFPRDGRDPDGLRAVVEAALDRNDLPRLGAAIVATEGAMRDVYALAERAAQGSLPVLLTGETGVGKEVMAEFLHRRSPRADGPFLCLNCAALPESMVESELFGHERGAYTGATQAKVGLFEAARGGTMLLDEIGELPLLVQAKLLRVFEARQVLRIGSVTPRPIDVRFLAATNRDLEAEVAAGRFRKDLYFRLKGLVITIPPLRARRAELAQLARTFVDDQCRAIGRRPAPAWSAEAQALLDRYAWPGNVRELRNLVERALLLCDGATIEAAHLPPELAQPAWPDAPPGGGPEAQLRSQLAQCERQHLEDVLARCHGNQSQAAKLLGIARNTLIARIEAHGLARPRRRPSG